MSTVTLGFDGGPSVFFRHDPNNVQWNFKINTAVQQTIGGRVIQVTGATLSDITVEGSFGEKKASSAGNPPALSWQIAEKFLKEIKAMMEYQARDATLHQKMHKPAVFSYPPKGWRFGVYIKELTDQDGGSITHKTGKFAHGYRLTLFIVDDRSQNLIKAGHGNGVIASQREAAIEAYINRISDGIGWKQSDRFNGDSLGAGGSVSAAASIPKKAIPHGATGSRLG